MKIKFILLATLCMSTVLSGCSVYQTQKSPEVEVIGDTVANTSSFALGKVVDEVVLSSIEENIYSLPFEPNDYFNVDVVGKIPALEEFQRIELLGNGWSKIVFNNITGYIPSSHLRLKLSPFITEVSETMYIVTDVAPIHDAEQPHRQVDMLPIATQIQRVAIMGNEYWSRISYNDKIYYILSEHLSYERPVLFEDVDATLFAKEALSVYSNYKDGEVVGTLAWADSVKQVAIGDNGWSKVLYNDQEAFIQTDMLVESIFPIQYEDETCKITITRDWYKNAWCYTAHLEFTDYTRFGTDCANGKYNNGYETTSHAAERLNALFAVNGCYSAPYLGYTVVRSGVICNGAGRSMNLPGVYSSHTGLFLNAWGETYGGTKGIVGHNVKKLVEAGTVTDTFCFGPPSLINGKLQGYNSGARAQRTLIGTNGNPGDLWIVVSDGRYNDGESAGLTFYEGAQYLQELGCTFGIHLDGGGSSTMYFNGKVLNAVKGNERAVVDFLYFK